MSDHESNIHHYFRNIESKKISLIEASKLINRSYRQTKRLWKKYKEQGVKGIISKKKKRTKSNRSFSDNFKQEILPLLFKGTFLIWQNRDISKLAEQVFN